MIKNTKKDLCDLLILYSKILGVGNYNNDINVNDFINNCVINKI